MNLSNRSFWALQTEHTSRGLSQAHKYPQTLFSLKEREGRQEGEWEPKEKVLFGRLRASGGRKNLEVSFLGARNARGTERKGNFLEGEAES